MVCGAHHAVALDAKGVVFSWGLNDRGQLGLGDKKNRREPTRVLALKRHVIVDIAAGRDFSAAVDENGRVFCWGRNDIVPSIRGHKQ